MSKFYLIFFVALFYSAAFGQQKMPLIWESRIEHDIIYTGTGSEERGISFVASQEEITVLNNGSGNIIWNKKISGLISGLTEIDDLICYWEADALILIAHNNKTYQLVCIDILKGALLWQLDGLKKITESNLVYLRDVNAFAYSQPDGLILIERYSGTGIMHLKDFQGIIGTYYYDPDYGAIVFVNMEPDGFNAQSKDFKNQIIKINWPDGEVLWENTFKGKASLELMTKEPVFELHFSKGKVVLWLDGIYVYDYKNGTKEWSSSYSCSTYKMCKKPNGVKKFGIYNHVSSAIVNDKNIYAFSNNSEGNTTLINYDLESGNEKWLAPLDESRALPYLEVLQDEIIIQRGGAIETQAYFVEKSGDYFVYKWKRDHPLIKPAGITAISTSNGSKVWEYNADDDYLTNVVPCGNYLFVGTRDEILSIDKSNGNINLLIDNRAANIGEIRFVYKHNENIIIAIGEKGISAYNSNSGYQLYASGYKDLNFDECIGGFVIMRSLKDEMAVFDMESGHYKYYKLKSGGISTLSKNGKYLYVYGKKSVQKFRAN